jgi:hypothetical protein
VCAIFKYVDSPPPPKRNRQEFTYVFQNLSSFMRSLHETLPWHKMRPHCVRNKAECFEALSVSVLRWTGGTFSMHLDPLELLVYRDEKQNLGTQYYNTYISPSELYRSDNIEVIFLTTFRKWNTLLIFFSFLNLPLLRKPGTYNVRLHTY